MLRPFAIALTLIATVAAAGPIERTTRVVWRADTAEFGHYSGLAVSPDGSRIWTVGDKGHFAEADLTRRNGALTGVTLRESGPLLDPDGSEASGYRIDAEGLSRGSDGRLYVSFEAVDRISAYRHFEVPPEAVPTPREFEALQNNSAIEALAAGPGGTLYAIPERSGALDRPFPVFRYREGAWSIPFSVPRRPPFLVVGAEIGPDGRLYILERDHGLLGFRSRIRRFEIGAAELKAEETLIESGRGMFDNLEGMALWRDANGQIRILCISDDNGRFFQRTELVEFTLAAGAT